MRKKTRNTGSENEPAQVAATVVSGSIRTPDESEMLKVELDFSSGRVTMHADGAEIGSWPSEAVSINALDSITFSFVAEGDHLIFSPDDPGAFGIVPLVEADDEPVGNRSRRKPKKKTSNEAQPPARNNTKTSAAKKKPAKKKPRKTPGRSSRAASKKRDKTATGKTPAGRTGKKIRATRTSPAAIASDVDDGGSPRRGESRVTRSTEKKTSVWIRTLDTARRHDFFGLDRVQIDEGLRGQAHEHTWDHRVAPKAGPGKHICTICGRIRR